MTFKNYIENSQYYLGPVDSATMKADHEAILSFAARREDLVKKFEEKIHSVNDSEWLELAKQGVKYFIELRDKKRDIYGNMLYDESIEPMIWDHLSGKVAAIKVTM
jgi:hypothetical protein